MAKTANIMVRVEPDVKERVEDVLDKLGMSLSTALTLYLNQIDLQKKIPFEIALPVSMNALSEKQFDGLMEQAYSSVEQGQTHTLKQFKNRVKEFN